MSEAVEYDIEKADTCLKDYLEFARQILAQLVNASKETSETSVQFARDSIARGIRQTNAIRLLAEERNFCDGFAIFRSLVERALLFPYLNDNDEFDVFKKWCFVQKFKYNDKIKNSPITNNMQRATHAETTEEERDRYREYCTDSEVSDWRRPNLKDYAKEKDFPVFYDFAYDYGSYYVHPMIGDGGYDTAYLLDEVDDDLEERVDGQIGLLLHNTLLTLIALVQACLRTVDAWPTKVRSLQNSFLEAVGEGTYTGYEDTLEEVLVQGPADSGHFD